MKESDQAYLTGERTLFHKSHVNVKDAIFAEVGVTAEGMQ